jgi:putative salt-induced outer membrane protein YdiY
MLALASIVVGPAMAEESPKKLGWARELELHLVSTRGNSESDTLGLAAVFTRTMQRSTFVLSGRVLRASSGVTSRRAIGPSPGEFEVVETSTSVVTAEQYSLGGRYEVEVSEKLFWHASLRWERNEPAGLRDRVGAVGGVGHAWWDADSSRFRTDYGVTYTSQDDLVPTPGLDATFFGVKLSYDYWRRLTPSTELASALVVDHNLDASEDLRADLTHGLSVAINDRLAVKIGVQVLYDHLPALGLLPLEFPAGTPTGETVTVELETTDTIVTAALTVDF